MTLSVLLLTTVCAAEPSSSHSSRHLLFSVTPEQPTFPCADDEVRYRVETNPCVLDDPVLSADREAANSCLRKHSANLIDEVPLRMGNVSTSIYTFAPFYEPASCFVVDGHQFPNAYPKVSEAALVSLDAAVCEVPQGEQGDLARRAMAPLGFFFMWRWMSFYRLPYHSMMVAQSCTNTVLLSLALNVTGTPQRVPASPVQNLRTYDMQALAETCAETISTFMSECNDTSTTLAVQHYEDEVMPNVDYVGALLNVGALKLCWPPDEASTTANLLLSTSYIWLTDDQKDFVLNEWEFEDAAGGMNSPLCARIHEAFAANVQALTANEVESYAFLAQAYVLVVKAVVESTR